MEQNVSRMMRMLRNELTGEALDQSILQGMTPQDWSQILALSKAHDIAHLLGDLISRDELLPAGDLRNGFDEAFCEAVLRAQLFETELHRICSVFQKAEIDFLPLKGAVIRHLYPEPWMRTSCDIDILIRPEQTKLAKKRLMEELHYHFEKQAYHELSFFSPSGVHLELHFTIEEHTETLDRVLKRSWDYAEPVKEGSFQYRFQNSFFVFHSVAHAAYHFAGGGCGVRPLIDRYLLEQKVAYDRKQYEDLICEAKLSSFEKQFDRLWRVWFSDGEHDDLTRRMENYLLPASIYGSLQNQEAIRLIRRGRLGNLLYRIWLPYESLVIKYPSLKNKRILQPLYEIRRWFTLFKRGKMKTIRKEVKTNLAVEQDRRDRIQSLLTDLDLPRGKAK